MADNIQILNPSITKNDFDYVNGDPNDAISGISGHALVAGGSSEDPRVTQALETANKALTSATAASNAADEAKASIDNGKFVSYATAGNEIYGFDKNGNLSAVYSQAGAWNTLNSEINKLSATIQTNYVSASEAQSFSSTLYTMANSAGNDANGAKTLAETANTNAGNALAAATSAGNLAKAVSARLDDNDDNFVSSAAVPNVGVYGVSGNGEWVKVTQEGAAGITSVSTDGVTVSGDGVSKKVGLTKDYKEAIEGVSGLKKTDFIAAIPQGASYSAYNGESWSAIPTIAPQVDVKLTGENGVSAAGSNNEFTIGLSASYVNKINGAIQQTDFDTYSASVGTSAAGLSAAVKGVQDTIAEQLEITGAGSVHVTTASNKLIISGDEVNVPANVMTSGDDMTTGQWIWNDGKFIQGTSYYANYKTYTTNPDAGIEVPLSGIYMTTHNNHTSTNYNYIKTYAYNNSKGITTGMLYTLPNHWSTMITTAGNGLVTAFNGAKWQISASIPDNIVTSAGLDANSAYCLTTTGWKAFNPAGGGSEFTGVLRDDSLSGNGAIDKLGVNTPYLSNYFLPLSGGTVTPLKVDGVNASLNVSGDSYDIFKVICSGTTAIFGITNTEFAFIKTENKGNQLELSDDHLTYKTKNMASTYLIPVYSAEALDSGKLYAMNGDGSTWTEVHNTSFVSGQEVSYNNNTFNYIPAKIEPNATASGSWNNDGILHFILE